MLSDIASLCGSESSTRSVFSILHPESTEPMLSVSSAMEAAMQPKDIVEAESATLARLPLCAVEELSGEQLQARAGETICVSTVGEDGWPHAALLSTGEVLAVSATELLVAVWPSSNTSKNLRREGRLTLSLVADGALIYIRATATLEAEHQTSLDLTVFRLQVEAVKEDRSTYADVTSGVTFRLHDPEQTVTRWREQITKLKEFAR
jgi:pyridoxamine 5'-phosphate oxidase-like protein